MSEEKVTDLRGYSGAAMPNEVQMQNTISQLRTNAKSHKKTVDKLNARISELRQGNERLLAQRDKAMEAASLFDAELESRCMNEKATAGELAKYALITVLFGFLATFGGICAYGWFMAFQALIN